jgi:hypothetical protein
LLFSHPGKLERAERILDGGLSSKRQDAQAPFPVVAYAGLKTDSGARGFNDPVEFVPPQEQQALVDKYRKGKKAQYFGIWNTVLASKSELMPLRNIEVISSQVVVAFMSCGFWEVVYGLIFPEQVRLAFQVVE